MRRNIIKILVGAAITAILVVLPFLVSAYQLLEPLPGLDLEIKENVLASYLSWLFRFGMAAVAFLAVLKIVIGGLHIIVGGASEAARSKGREMIEMALWGLLLAISSVLILTTINPDLVKTGLTIPPIVIEKGEEKLLKGGQEIGNGPDIGTCKGNCFPNTPQTGLNCENLPPVKSALQGYEKGIGECLDRRNQICCVPKFRVY